MNQFTTKLLLLFLSLGTFSGCLNYNYIETVEDRMVGTWFFDKVTVTGFFTHENVTADYRKDEVQFFEDNTVIYTFGNGDMWEGIFQYELISTGEESADEIILSLTNPQTNEQVLYVWENVSVTENVIRGNEDINNDNYRYVLRKI